MFDENVEKESTSPPPKIENIKNKLFFFLSRILKLRTGATMCIIKRTKRVKPTFHLANRTSYQIKNKAENGIN